MFTVYAGNITLNYEGLTIGVGLNLVIIVPGITPRLPPGQAVIF